MPSVTRLIVVCLGLLVLSGSAFTQEDGGLTLTVKVAGAKPNVGDAIFSLFSEENYLAEPLFDATVSINAAGEAQFNFDNIAPGIYSVSVIYDKNRDGKLNTGLFGIPTEKIAMSNNAKGRFGPPSFKQTSFAITETSTIEILFSKVKK